MRVDDFISELKNTIVDLGVSGVMAYLTLQVPYLVKMPIVGALIKAIVRKVLELAIYYTELGAYFIYADAYTLKQATDFVNAAKEFEAVKLKGNQDEIEKARQAKMDHFRNLVKFRN